MVFVYVAQKKNIMEMDPCNWLNHIGVGFYWAKMSVFMGGFGGDEGG